MILTMYIEFKGGLIDGKRIYLAIPSDTFSTISKNNVVHYYRKTNRITEGRWIVYQYIGTAIAEALV